MRKPFVAGNWKMNLNREQAVALAGGLAERIGKSSEVEVAVCPPNVYLDAVSQAVKGSAIGLGAQDMYHEPSGAFTGETSAAMLVDLACTCVILGHSERRNILGETSQEINKKVVAALEAGLTPIICLGELLEQREAGKTLQVIGEQFDGTFQGLSAAQVRTTVIAYEPVWAIGTGKVATPQQADQVHRDLRRMLEQRYNGQVASEVRIQYGGSVKPGNAAELLSQDNIDGALVGGASLQVDDFLAIVAAAN